MANYRINEKNKTISVGANITEAEKNALAIYISAGYTVRAKSEVKSAQAKKKADALPKKAEIIKILEDNKKAEELKIFKEMCEDKEKGNFFKARAWYLKEVKPTLEK